MLQMRHVSVLGFVAAFAALVLSSSESHADSNCSSSDSCGRTVTCPSNYSVGGSTSGWYCSRTILAVAVNPTCGFYNMRNDWVWNASAKTCVNGVGTSTTQNIRCEDGYTYDSGSGKCEKPATTAYSHPILTTNGVFSGTSRACSSQSSCQDALKCTKSGYVLGLRSTPSSKEYFCSKTTPAINEAPKCVFHNMRNDWTWDASNKVCKNGLGTTTTVNRRCDAGNYNDNTGRCEAPAVVAYDEPTLD
ncbi:MAG: hypothetical protein U0270_00225 [Labilithrix sp.]